MKFDLLLDGKAFNVELGLGKTIMVRLDGETLQAEVRRTGQGMNILLDGESSFVQMADGHISIDGHRHRVEVRNLRRGRPSWYRSTGHSHPKDGAVGRPAAGPSPGEGMVHPPMPGRVVSVYVKEGDEVRIGCPLLVLEAMKMQNEILSSVNGAVREIRVSEGDLVESGNVLMVIGEQC